MIYFIITALVILGDFITKRFALRLATTGEIKLIKDVLHFTYTENRGIAFGAFSGGRIFFIVLTVLLVGVILLYMLKHTKEKKTRWLKIGVALTVGGAIGNLIDRIILGYVIDFINFEIINFPVFNVADIAVCVGVALIAVHLLFFDESEENK